MKNSKKIITLLTASLAALTLGGCSARAYKEEEEIYTPPVTQTEEEEETPAVALPEITLPEVPAVKEATYIKVTGNGVNIRSGAGADYSKLGTAENNTMYAYCGKSGSWYKTKYKDRTAYISEKYCSLTKMTESGNEKIESVIQSGLRFMGVEYVYGAVRLHDGKGNRLKNFTTQAFDCSSLMQYIFSDGAGALLDVNTRTQIYQGTTVSRANLKRGDLMFFTNASRKNNKGVERVGHVALYLGDNYILHTASDYAKIEQISSARWGYFIQGQRIL
ncbi:MAG: C40 family peptidase [Muribaculaceae bacterium]|nr:C40 family peptidase [Muribaculaceae bacterium]